MNLVDDPKLATLTRASSAIANPLALDDVIAEIAARRDEFDQLSHVPRDMIATMKRARIFRASSPRCFGGDALAPADFLCMLERIAVADGSTAWVAAFGSANVYLAALPLEIQRETYANGPDQVFAGGLYPVQPAVAASRRGQLVGDRCRGQYRAKRKALHDAARWIVPSVRHQCGPARRVFGRCPNDSCEYLSAILRISVVVDSHLYLAERGWRNLI
jgi:hypothetical protein